MSDDDRYALERALRDFEPVFWVAPGGESLERLYEPDGTLYAICLDGPVVVSTDRRHVTVNRGDAVILPPMVAVELSGPARWFGLVYTGDYPYHFRERFIQVWGFEHVASRFGESQQPRTNPQTLPDPRPRDLRHRLYLAFGHEATDGASSGPEFVVHLRLDPQSPEGFRVAWEDPAACGETGQKNAVNACPGEESVVLRIPTEAVYLTHRQARPPAPDLPAMSPEYRPEP